MKYDEEVLLVNSLSFDGQGIYFSAEDVQSNKGSFVDVLSVCR